MAETVTNILPPPYFVSNISHQHRCNRVVENIEKWESLNQETLKLDSFRLSWREPTEWTWRHRQQLSTWNFPTTWVFQHCQKIEWRILGPMCPLCPRSGYEYPGYRFTNNLFVGPKLLLYSCCSLKRLLLFVHVFLRINMSSIPQSEVECSLEWNSLN